MSFLSELIRGTDDRPLVLVPTPEWGKADGKLFVRRFSPLEKLAFWEAVGVNLEWRDFVVATVAFCTVDAEGNRVFSDDDRAWLGAEKSTAPVDRLFDATDDLNIFSQRAEESAKKNLGTTPSFASTSPSPDHSDAT